MTTEAHTITVTAYRTPDGRPTCCARWPDSACPRSMPAQMCQFLRTTRMGTVELCGATGDELQRHDDGFGYLIPAEGCPVWSDVDHPVPSG